MRTMRRLRRISGQLLLVPPASASPSPPSAQRSPLEHTVSATFAELLEHAREAEKPALEQLRPFFSPEESLSFEVRTPAGNAAEPPGILIYISPKPGATMPPEWGAVLDARNLTWVGALGSENAVQVQRRVGLALLGKTIAAREGPVDLTRSYLTGLSGGGRVASILMQIFPGRFAGAIFICGANPLLDGAPKETIEALQGTPLVFLTGSGDFNLTDTQFAIETFRHAGLEKTELMIIDGLGHALPDAKGIETALGTLEKIR